MGRVCEGAEAWSLQRWVSFEMAEASRNPSLARETNGASGMAECRKTKAVCTDVPAVDGSGARKHLQTNKVYMHLNF